MRPDQIEVLKQGAESGDTTSKLMYGLALVQGRFVAQDLEAGLGHIRESAAGGHPEAMFFLAVYQLDQGGKSPENLELARQLLEKAAYTGHVKSQIELAKSYLSGNYWPASDEQALMWMRFAAKEGQGVAYLLLGFFFLDRGMNQDAIHMMRLAERAGEKHVAEVIQESLDGLKEEGFTEDLEGYALKVIAQTLGREAETLAGLLPELEKDPSAAAAKTLSVMHDYGYGTPINPVKSTEWLGIAADRGDAEARHFHNERKRVGYLGEGEKSQ